MAGLGPVLSDATEGRTELARAQRRLQLLTEANQTILSELTLTTVLREIASSARELVGARYAALGVLGLDGRLSEFIHVGMDQQTVGRIGGLPEGRGLLGALINDPVPLRLDHITDDSRSAGFPEHHPPMDSFLGVPIKVRGVVYGNLYLTERLGGGGFSEEDLTTISALGVTAGIAIENARLYGESERRQQWAQAAAAVSSALLDPSSGNDPVALVAETVLRLTQADVVSVVVPDTTKGMFRVQLARGDGASEIEGLRYPTRRSIAARALESGRGVRVDSLHHQQDFSVHLSEFVDVDSVLGLPLHGSSGSHGVLSTLR